MPLLLYDAYSEGGYDVPGVHDPDDRRLFGIVFKPYQYAVGQVYYEGDILVPTVFAGMYYEVVNPGLAPDEPTHYNAHIGQETHVHGSSLILKAHSYKLMPLSEAVTEIIYTSNNGVTISDDTFNDFNCQFVIDPIVIGAEARLSEEFSILAHITKSNTAEFDMTVNFKIGDR